MATGYQSKFKGSEVDEYLSYAKKIKEDGLEPQLLKGYATENYVKSAISEAVINAINASY